MSTHRICLLGGSGFVGRHLAARLSAQRHQVTVVSRRRERHRELLVLPTVTMTEGDPNDMGFLRALFQDYDTVINLVAILNERGRDGSGFRRAHVELANKLIDACRQAGVGRLLHISALGASPEGPSHYLRTKGQAENIVHEAASEHFRVTSFRPSVIFGPGDSFFNRFAALLRRVPGFFPFFPLACPHARFQPVYVEDVVGAMVASLSDHRSYGRRYDLCGPKTYTLQQLVAYTAQIIGVRRRIVPLNDWQSRLQARIMEHVPGKPFTMDNYRSTRIDNVCDGPFPPEFGITPRAVEEIVPGYLG